jgi:hypothetical protein
MAAYERAEMQIYDNERIRQFIYAQREFNKLHDLISAYVIGTIELGRLPGKEELNTHSGGCGCGGNCGCSH